MQNNQKDSSSFLSMTGNLLLIHLLFILLTPLILHLGYFSVVLTLCYVLVLFIIGFLRSHALNITPLKVLAAGYCSQLPGIIPSIFVIIKKLLPFPAVVFEFLGQIWQTPFYPVYPLLPRTSVADIPLYFMINLIISLIIPLIPAAGAYISKINK
ncbi:MAG TPA: hypothetical protein GXX21_08935 [Syntrophomonadaceae bacterium]|nr:hypothetical protein [Syntrophomonadaceae bacterium]